MSYYSNKPLVDVSRFTQAEYDESIDPALTDEQEARLSRRAYEIAAQIRELRPRHTAEPEPVGIPTHVSLHAGDRGRRPPHRNHAS